MPCGTILLQTTKILCTANVSNFLRRTVGCARMHTPDTPRWPRDWYLSLENKSQSACLVKHTAQSRSVPLRNSVQVSVVCRLCVQTASGTRHTVSVRLMQERTKQEPTLPRFRAPTHSPTRLFASLVTGVCRGVKDCVLTQPIVDSAHEHA